MLEDAPLQIERTEPIEVDRRAFWTDRECFTVGGAADKSAV